jgi:putative ABC transport system substrate-binding protein
MKRRAFMAGVAALSCGRSLRTFAQGSRRTYHVGVLSTDAGLVAGRYAQVLQDTLAAAGLVHGRNLSLTFRFPSYGPGEAIEVTRELLALNVDAILACTTPLALAAARATRTVPVVFAWVADPLASGIVPDLAGRSRNVTGVTNRNLELMPKRMELAAELLPGARRFAVLAGYIDATLQAMIAAADGAARRLGVELVPITVGTDWRAAIERTKHAGAQGALVATPFAMFGMREAAAHIVEEALAARMPVLYVDSDTVEIGGLLSYATSLGDDMRGAAQMLARILLGEAPANLPVNQASRFELAVNLRTAREMGLTVRRSIVLRADRVIE